jgi:hypothetical protein
MNRPSSFNAMTVEMGEQFQEAVRQLSLDQEVTTTQGEREGEERTGRKEEGQGRRKQVGDTDGGGQTSKSPPPART